MKKILSVLLIGVLSIVGIVSFNTIQAKKMVSPTVPNSTSSTLGATSSPTEPTSPPQAVALPQALIIPKLGVNAPVEYKGMDSKGNMAVPDDADNVAWYKLGFKPGENGSSVMAGHFDRVSGAPAVFYDLGSLKAGDTVQVKQTDGNMLTFKVTSSATYAFDTLPLQAIFNTPGKPALNLITCDGVFNTSAKNYSQRLVVYTALAEM